MTHVPQAFEINHLRLNNNALVHAYYATLKDGTTIDATYSKSEQKKHCSRSLLDGRMHELPESVWSELHLMHENPGSGRMIVLYLPDWVIMAQYRQQQNSE